MTQRTLRAREGPDQPFRQGAGSAQEGTHFGIEARQVDQKGVVTFQRRQAGKACRHAGRGLWIPVAPRSGGPVEEPAKRREREHEVAHGDERDHELPARQAGPRT